MFYWTLNTGVPVESGVNRGDGRSEGDTGTEKGSGTGSPGERDRVKVRP